ncbi:MAG: hypothetical protein ACXWIH_24805 [Burkholderiales bacterium]
MARKSPVPHFGCEFAIMEIRGRTKRRFPPGTVLAGDTLFAVGCGRPSEGTPEQMYDSLNRLAAVLDNTRVYCGHEYTL